MREFYQTRMVVSIDNDDFESFFLTKGKLVAFDCEEFDLWNKPYKLVCKMTKVNLVLLNFVNDPTWDIEERVPNAAIWKEHYNNIFMSMKITKELLEKEGVKEIEYSALFVQ